MTEQSNRYLFVVTCFDDGDADRTAVPFVLANNALAAGADVLVWLTLRGVELAKPGGAERVRPASFPPLGELLQTYRGAGGRIGVCPPCAKTHGVTQENALPGTEWIGASAFLGEAQTRQSLTF